MPLIKAPYHLLLTGFEVIVQEHDNGEIEISAVDPVASMMAVTNDTLGNISTRVREKLKRVIDHL